MQYNTIYIGVDDSHIVNNTHFIVFKRVKNVQKRVQKVQCLYKNIGSLMEIVLVFKYLFSLSP